MELEYLPLYNLGGRWLLINGNFLTAFECGEEHAQCGSGVVGGRHFSRRSHITVGRLGGIVGGGLGSSLGMAKSDQ